MAITRDAVVWGFRLILGREPESEEGIRAHMGVADEAALISVLMRSQEFRASGRLSNTVVLREGQSNERSSPWSYQSRSSKKLVIFGNCQASTVGRLVQAMTGDVVTRSHETTPSFMKRLRDGELDLAVAVGDADLVWVQMVGEVTKAIVKRLPKLADRIRQLPPLNYSGFHPDCVYVARREGGYLQGPMGEYQSSIAFWAWRQGLPPDVAIDLFRDEVFEHLGFYRYHQAAWRVLQNHGQNTGLPMAKLMDCWHQTGCFMHTVNHPKLPALADMVEHALRRDGITPVPEGGQWVEDTLARWPVWPVYPDIARRSGTAGSYVFKLDRGFCPESKPVLTMDLAQFIAQSYKVFERTPDLSCERTESAAYRELPRFIGERPSRPSAMARMAAAIGATLTPLLRPAQPESAAVNPYEGLPDDRFWRRAVERVAAQEIDPVVRVGFTIDSNSKVATAGSCFAQHIARTLAREHFNYMVVDRPPGLSDAQAKARNFGVYSARYGNVYTARQLVQLFDQAHGHLTPHDKAWRREDKRWVDPFRPQVEPAGHESAQQVEQARRAHLADVRKMFAELDVFIFTLGLTEAWRRRDDGAVFPLAPGVVAGSFDPEIYEFVNFDADEVVADLRSFIRRLRAVNDRARIILTVSPVPLIATYEDRHVLVSTVHSKSILRSAAGTVAKEYPGHLDYFPSYEIITGPPSRGAYFEQDLRSVSEAGVAHVMRTFMRHYGQVDHHHTQSTAQLARNVELLRTGEADAIEREQRALDDIVCDEEAIDRHRQ